MIVNAIVNGLIHRAKVFGVVAVGIGGFAAYDKYDKGANYMPVQARITDVQDMCFMEKRSGRTREYSDIIACNMAEAAVKLSPKWQGFDIKHKITVAYDYVSPVDRKTHSGKREMSAFPNGKKLSLGEIFNVRASKTDANKSREI